MNTANGLKASCRHALEILAGNDPEGVSRTFLRELGVKPYTIRHLTGGLLATVRTTSEGEDRYVTTETGKAALKVKTNEPQG
jgi:hypothetical protein